MRRKPGARLLVDKYPMRGLYANFLSRFSPGQRSIICIRHIRHPYDVVLSYFRQRFIGNAAMESFRDWKSRIALYYFTMTEWFSAYRVLFEAPEAEPLRRWAAHFGYPTH